MLKWLLKFFKKPAKVTTEPVAKVQMMVTKKMRNELCQLGWTKFEVDSMSPQTAADVISRQQSPTR